MWEDRTLMDFSSIYYIFVWTAKEGWKSMVLNCSWDGRVYDEEAQMWSSEKIGFKKGSLPTGPLRTKMCETQTLEIAFFRELSFPSVAFESDVHQTGLEV